MNVNVDTLSHILQMDHDQHIETDMVQVIVSNSIQGATLVETFLQCTGH